MRPDLVVKLGGSVLSDQTRLGQILQQIADSPLRVLVVPGGGPFADTVRDAQARHRFNDAVAHDMAVLATHQMGLLLNALQPQVIPVRGVDDLTDAFRDGDQAVALAGGFLDLLDNDALPKCWAATSDAIAAWLAVQLDAPMLAFVKSCPIAPDASLQSLRDNGILDPVSVEVLNEQPVDVRCFGPADGAALDGLLSDAGGVREDQF
ncbi:MAG: uridylate kinase [Pseudomonadota bacterium]